MTTTDFKIKVNKKILTVDSINANDLETINNIKREELKRQKNETERKLNEETRKIQEEDRKINDKARQSQEVARQEAELLRETQESTRQENELLREEIFNSSQQERDSKFIDAQNDRENTFNLNERERKNTFTSNEQDRTNVFNTNELTRNENEETRKSQENERVNAENIRKSNEEIRTSNEIDRENRFDIVEANANSLIEEMQNTIDSNIGTEVIEARKDKAKLGLRLDDIETQSVENTNSIENILQELINCIKKDGSIPFENGQDKGIKIGEIARITVEGNNILIHNRSNGLHSLQLTNDGHFLLSEGGKIGSGNYPISELWLGERSITENGYSKLPNGLIIQWGRGMVSESNSGAYNFPIAFPNDCLAIGLSGSWNSTRDYFLRMGRVSKSTYGQYSSSVEHNEVSWMAIGY